MSTSTIPPTQDAPTTGTTEVVPLDESTVEALDDLRDDGQDYDDVVTELIATYRIREDALVMTEP